MWFIKLRKKLLELIRFSLTGKKNKCIILGTPSHKNLGDHAIVYAQYKYIRDNFKDCNILELSRLEYDTYKVVVKLLASKKTLLVVDGGGNLGSLWPVEDECIRDVLGRFKDNPLLVFPQTAFYDNTEEGKALFEQTVKLIDNKRKLLFMFRDKKSFELFEGKVAADKLLLCPDIVTYVDDANVTDIISGNKIGICFRDDKEMVMSKEERESILDVIEKAGYSPMEISTISPRNIYAPERNTVLKDKWAEFVSCRMIITDRLHGMIFSAITGTECVAFDNISKKVAGGYEWLKELEYIHYCDSLETFKTSFDNIISKGQAKVVSPGEAKINKKLYDREKVVQQHYDRVKKFITDNSR